MTLPLQSGMRYRSLVVPAHSLEVAAQTFCHHEQHEIPSEDGSGVTVQNRAATLPAQTFRPRSLERTERRRQLVLHNLDVIIHHDVISRRDVRDNHNENRRATPNQPRPDIMR